MPVSYWAIFCLHFCNMPDPYWFDVISLNFWDEAWCAIFHVWFFGLLSSSLLLLVVTQCIHSQINKEHLRRAGGYSGLNVAATIKMRTTVGITTQNIAHQASSQKFRWIMKKKKKKKLFLVFSIWLLDADEVKNDFLDINVRV